jgi:hypothetical protein
MVPRHRAPDENEESFAVRVVAIANDRTSTFVELTTVP